MIVNVYQQVKSRKEIVNNYQEVREWLVSLLDTTTKPFTPEVDQRMQELWKKRGSVFGERRAIVHAFEAVLKYRAVEGKFTPCYFEKQDRIKALWSEVLQRAQALKEYIEKYVMDEQEVLQVLGEVGAVIADSHIVYTSGKHGTAYVNKDAVYPHTAETSRLCRAIAERFADDNVQVVIAPAIGGVIISQWMAHHLTEMNAHEVFGVYAEKSEGGDVFVIKRGYDKLVAGKRVLVVEDVLTTGGSARKVVEATKAIGGDVVGLGVLCNRGGITAEDVGVPRLFALLDVKLDAWDEKDCPLCAQGVPINTDVGKGREFLASKQAS